MTMGAFLSYSIVSGLLMLSMFLAYRVFLARENQHDYNRCVLLAIYFISFATLPVIDLIQSLTISAPTQGMMLEEIEITAGTITSAAKPIWGTLLIWLFIAGMAVVTVKTVVIWIRLVKVIRSGEKITQGEYTLVLTDDEKLAPFSWLRYIVISRADYNSNCLAITTHEMKHVACRHWIDLLVAQIVCIVNWFNPAVWLMRDELMLVHEYQADMAVIDSGHNPQDYQMLLIKKAVGARFPSLANSLNHSKLKKRITMMYKEKSGAGRKMKALALVPMLALALLVAAVPSVRAAVSTISNSGVSVSKGSENTLTREEIMRNFSIKDISNTGNSTIVTLRGVNAGSELTVSGGKLTVDGQTYEAKSLNSELSDGTANIKFMFNKIRDLNKDITLSFTINGEDMAFVRLGASKGTSTALTNKTIYVDGNIVTEEEMKKISPSEIAEMTVEQDAIRITLKKK